MFKIISLLASLFILITFGNNIFAANIANCRRCHTVERIDSNHAFRCISCHLLPKYRSAINSHKNIIKNPSSLKYAGLLCAKCHKQDILFLKHSLHGTLTGAITLTRYIWGAGSLKPEYGIVAAGRIKKLPEPPYKLGKDPAAFVDDFLRRKCLRCHLYNNGTDDKVGALGLYRAKGCAACHMKFEQDGSYMGSDSLMKGKKVYSANHKFLMIPPMDNCLSCHNTEFVGTDYKGLFPHDYAYSFNSPILPSGNFPDSTYGIESHHLISDIHYRKGMTCVDCHRKADSMGDGHFYSSEMENGAVKVSCESCHGGFNSKPNQKWVNYKDGIYYFKSVTGRIYHVKQFDKVYIPHKPFHKRLACSACHSAWQNENYQLSLFRNDKADYSMWRDLTSQEDPYLENFLSKALKKASKNISPTKPKMPDRITGKMYNGIWYSGWTMRRWNYFTLGIAANGKIKILRPLFEYRLSYKNASGDLLIDNIGKTNGRQMRGFVPYDPHTTTLYGKSCQMCHENRYILDKKQLAKDKTVIRLLYGQVIHGKNLSKNILKKMQSSFYRKTAAGMFYKRKY